MSYFCHLKSRVWRLIFEKTMETKYVYRDAVLPKAALQGKTFNLIAALCVRYPQGKQVRLDFEVCSPSSAFARRLQEYEAIYAKDGDDDGVRIDGLDIVHSDECGSLSCVCIATSRSRCTLSVPLGAKWDIKGRGRLNFACFPCGWTYGGRATVNFTFHRAKFVL